MPLVSVIIPTYNRAFCIERALHSVFRQTFQEFEVLVCDDASTDATCAIVQRYAAGDARLKLLQLATNQGPGAARNLGMEASKGDYIAFLDSDDEWLQEKLERQVERMEADPPDVGVCFCGATIIKDGNVHRPVAYVPNVKWEQDTFRKWVMDKISFLTPTVLFRRVCLDKSGLMVPELRRGEDVDFLLRILATYRLAVIPESYVVCHLAVSQQKGHYDVLIATLPYRLRNRNWIQSRAGYWPALYYCARLRTNLLTTAIREQRWTEAIRDFGNRLKEFPFLLPRDIMRIVRAICVAFLKKQ